MEERQKAESIPAPRGAEAMPPVFRNRSAARLTNVFELGIRNGA